MNVDPQNLQSAEPTEQQLSEQEGIRRDKLQRLTDAGMSPYSVTRYPVTHRSAEILASFDDLEGKVVRIAGRMISRRIMGKASFAHMLDGEGADTVLRASRRRWRPGLCRLQGLGSGRYRGRGRRGFPHAERAKSAFMRSRSPCSPRA